MARLTVACFLLFVTAALSVAAEPGSFSFSLRSGSDLTVSKAPRWCAEGQYSLPALLRFSYDAGRHWSFSLTSGYRYTGESPAGVNEVALRGHHDFVLGVGSAYRFAPILQEGAFQLEPRVGLSGYAHIGVYKYTSVHFFYPSLEIEPAMRIARLYGGFLTLSAGLPLRFDFRRDLEYSFSLGAAVDITVYLPDN